MISIGEYTTFKLPTRAQNMIVFQGGDIVEFFKQIPNDNHVFVLGGGSNIILPPELPNTTVIKIANKGIEILSEDEKNAIIKVASGEVWDDVVAWSVSKNLAGIEALSAIPGTTGGTPIQNVGAYGSEIKDTLLYVEAYDIGKKEVAVIQNAECGFAYRTSKFKTKWKHKFLVTHIVLKLSKDSPRIPDYKGVKDYFKNLNITNPTLTQIRNTITEIRWAKLPHPEDVPNCGSFFENPIVSNEEYKNLKVTWPDMPNFPVENNKVKIPAGWLIEHAQMKGADFGSVGTYEKNALVLINKGSATQKDVINARNKIIEKVYQKFGITLESEPEIVT